MLIVENAISRTVCTERNFFFSSLFYHRPLSGRLFTQHPVTLRYYLVSRTFNSIAAVKHSTPLQLQTSTMKHAISKLFLTGDCKSVTLTNSLNNQQAKYFVSINISFAVQTKYNRWKYNSTIFCKSWQLENLWYK